MTTWPHSTRIFFRMTMMSNAISFTRKDYGGMSPLIKRGRPPPPPLPPPTSLVPLLAAQMTRKSQRSLGPSLSTIAFKWPQPPPSVATDGSIPPSIPLLVQPPRQPPLLPLLLTFTSLRVSSVTMDSPRLESNMRSHPGHWLIIKPLAALQPPSSLVPTSS